MTKPGAAISLCALVDSTATPPTIDMTSRYLFSFDCFRSPNRFVTDKVVNAVVNAESKVGE